MAPVEVHRAIPACPAPECLAQVDQEACCGRIDSDLIAKPQPIPLREANPNG